MNALRSGQQRSETAFLPCPSGPCAHTSVCWKAQEPQTIGCQIRWGTGALWPCPTWPYNRCEMSLFLSYNNSKSTWPYKIVLLYFCLKGLAIPGCNFLFSHFFLCVCSIGLYMPFDECFPAALALVGWGCLLWFCVREGDFFLKTSDDMCG